MNAGEILTEESLDTQGQSTTSVQSRSSSQAVVLVHGLAANRLVMWPIAKRLRQMGYRVKNHGYFSISKTIPYHAQRLGEVIADLQNDTSIDRVHLVTHSMGCIISRHLLNQQKFSKLDRWVMLAPPNRGSHTARVLAPILGKLCTPLAQLSDAPDSFVNQIKDFRRVNDVKFAIVEAAYDRVIDSACVPLDGQSDYAIVDSNHGPLPWHSKAIDYVEAFLSRSVFESGS